MCIQISYRNLLLCVLTETIKDTKLKSKLLFCFRMIAIKIHRHKRKVPDSNSEAAVPEDALFPFNYLVRCLASAAG